MRNIRFDSTFSLFHKGETFALIFIPFFSQSGAPFFDACNWRFFFYTDTFHHLGAYKFQNRESLRNHRGTRWRRGGDDRATWPLRRRRNQTPMASADMLWIASSTASVPIYSLARVVVWRHGAVPNGNGAQILPIASNAHSVSFKKINREYSIARKKNSMEGQENEKFAQFYFFLNF